MTARAWQWFYMIVWASIILAMAGCAHTPEPEPQELFEQIPAWDNSVNRCCGGKLVCEPYQSRYC